MSTATIIDSKPVINLSGVSKSFGATQVLKEITLDVRPGEVLVLIGASGSGKSTVLRIMSGLETADSGEVWVNQVPLHDARRAKEIRGHVGMVFQQFNLFPHKTALGNVTLALIKARKMSPADARKRGMEALDRVGLAIPASSPAVSSNAWRLRARWRWSLASCSSTKPPPRLTRNSSAK
jgi:polar amino acid transport system ATP-binding protein